MIVVIQILCIQVMSLSLLNFTSIYYFKNMTRTLLKDLFSSLMMKEILKVTNGGDFYVLKMASWGTHGVLVDLFHCAPESVLESLQVAAKQKVVLNRKWKWQQITIPILWMRVSQDLQNQQSLFIQTISIPSLWMICNNDDKNSCTKVQIILYHNLYVQYVHVNSFPMTWRHYL